MNIHQSIPAAPTSKGDGWTKARVKLLKIMWAADIACADIAADLGTTKNAVIGKARRLRLASRAPEELTPEERRAKEAEYHRNYNLLRRSQRLAGTSRVPRRKKGGDNGGGTLHRLRSKQDQFFAAEIDATPMRAADVVPLNLPLTELAPHACHWPYGDGPFTFCGNPALPEQPYCRAHDRLAHSSAVEISEAERARRVALGKRSTATNKRNGKFS